MSRAANPDYPIHELFIQRHSPYAFDPGRPVDAATVYTLIEAARWTMSSHNGKPNSAAEHDLGAASAFLTLEAVPRGLCVHQMIGIDPDKVIATFAPGPDIRSLTALAIGYQGTSEHIPEAYAARDGKPRERLAQSEILL